MNRQQIYSYYSNDFVVEQLMKYSKKREVAGAFWNGAYDKRPNILQYPSDITQMVRNGVTSFHLSVEHWSNAMALTNEKEGYDKLRTGWDMIIDIDSKLGLEESKVAAELIRSLLKKYGIKNYGIKFSGRRGFHICLPWIMFPKAVDYKKTELMYPDIPRITARFIRKKIKSSLMDHLIRSRGAKQLIEMLDEVPEKFNPYFFVDVEKDWGNRHMFRAPFSLNEKAWLVSVPVQFNRLKDFSAESAKPENVISHSGVFEEFMRGEENEAVDLVTDAMDWYATIKKEPPKPKGQRMIVWDGKISEEYFPPCIKNILSGLTDGRKRSIFTLVNFLRMTNWPWEEIEQKIYEWNEKNRPPLPRNIILGHLRSSQRNTKNYNPANCPPEGDLFYMDTVNICRPDNICKQGTSKIAIKNPIVYPFRLMKISSHRQKKTYRGYSCGVCNKEFKNTHSLGLHKSRMHNVEDV